MINREDLWNENDSATWDFIATGKTKTVFQLEKSGMKWAKQIKPRCIEELADLIAVIRPGCISEDCMILSSSRQTKRGRDNRRISMKKLYERWTENKIHTILSYDQQQDKFISNKIKNIFQTGEKPVWKINAKRNIKQEKVSICQLECTDDHPIYTNMGWKELDKLKSGDRIAVVKAQYSNQIQEALGSKSYRQICFENYLHKCIFCHWTGGTLDVNHINENRHINNGPDNLCFLCPNHHRMFTEGIISIEEIDIENQKHKLPNSNTICWYEYIDKKFEGLKKTYDISMEGPYHNFIAGNTVVHNCTDAELDGKSLTQVYADRKNGLMQTTFLHPALEPILKNTYGIIVYQEQAMRIAMEIAGFTEQKADELRKCMGKKDVVLMNKLHQDFIDGANEKKIVSQDIAEQIYDWIQASARYSFNLSHSVGYAYLAYFSAYAKTHDLIKTLAVNLSEAHNKPFKMEEIKSLIMDSRRFGIEIHPASIRHFHADFTMDRKKNIIYYGAAHIKNVGYSKFQIVKNYLKSVDNVDNISWMDLLIGLDSLNKDAFNALISCGSIIPTNTKLSRNALLYQYRKWSELTEKEKDYIKNNKVSESLEDNISFLINNAKINSRRIKSVISIYETLKNPPRKLEDDNIWLSNTEENLMGCALTCSKVDSVKYANEINLECRDISSGECGVISNICLGVKINSVKEYRITKQESKSYGKTMCFISAEDSSGELRSIALFPEEYNENKKLLFEGNTVLLYGDVNARKNELSFAVKKVKQI